jgi:hypothetical protein
MADDEEIEETYVHYAPRRRRYCACGVLARWHEGRVLRNMTTFAILSVRPNNNACPDCVAALKALEE